MIPCSSSTLICLTISAWFDVDCGRGGARFLGVCHLESSTTRSMGEILAGAEGSSLLKMSTKSRQRLEILASRSSSPAMCKDAIGSLGMVGSQGANVGVSWSSNSSSAAVAIVASVSDCVTSKLDNVVDDHESSTFAPWLPTIASDPIASLHIAGDEDLQA